LHKKANLTTDEHTHKSKRELQKTKLTDAVPGDILSFDQCYQCESVVNFFWVAA
jgi:hypothetical protein